MFLDVSCSSCYAASRRRPTAYLHCPANEPASTTTTLETLLETTQNSDDKDTLLADNKTVAICPCTCKTDFISILKLIEKRRKELIVNKSKLSANVRKRTCATDSRTSSTAIGLVSIIILIACGSMLIYSDVSSVLKLCYRKCNKLLQLYSLHYTMQHEVSIFSFSSPVFLITFYIRRPSVYLSVCL